MSELSVFNLMAQRSSMFKKKTNVASTSLQIAASIFHGIHVPMQY